MSAAHSQALLGGVRAVYKNVTDKSASLTPPSVTLLLQEQFPKKREA